MFLLKMLLASLVATMVVSCNKPNKSDSGDATPTKLDASKVYPHTESFKKNEHGAIFLQDRAICTSCHGVDNKGGTAQVSCTKCHSNYPHAEGWGTPQKHGATFLQDRTACLNCHGSDNTGGVSKVSCTKCHSSFPHNPGWATPQKHGGMFVNANGAERQACLNCHKPEATSGAVSCQTCHKAFPHSDEFKGGGDDHGTLAKKYEGSCTSCHTDFKRLMPNFEPDGCTTCHSDSVLTIHWVNSSPVDMPLGSKAHKDIKRGTASKPAIKKSKKNIDSK